MTDKGSHAKTWARLALTASTGVVLETTTTMAGRGSSYLRLNQDMKTMRRFALLLLFLAVPMGTHAGAAVLLAEPYGRLAKMSPTGHVAVYLDRVCAASPTQLRRCKEGEMGVVIGRYKKIAGYDWIAIPLMPYLYAVERSEDVPKFADRQTVALLRNEYRRRHLHQLVPDTSETKSPKGTWTQLIGAAYDRKIFVFEIETPESKDDELIEAFNSRANKSRFHALFHNCADFARDVINFYYPKALRRNLIADAGLSTPKHAAKSLVRYSKKHPELQFSAFAIQQVPGELPRSKGARGVLEALVKSKKYVVPMALAYVWLAPCAAVGYLSTGRFNPSRHATTSYGPAQLEQRAEGRAAALAASTPDEPIPPSFLPD